MLNSISCKYSKQKEKPRNFKAPILLLVFFTINIANISNVSASSYYEILVAPKKSDAYVNAKELSNESTIWAERKIHKAFKRASSLLTKCSSCNVTIKIASGVYEGFGRTGQWLFPETNAPKSNLYILGSYDDSFNERHPFDAPSMLKVTENRSKPVISFEGRKNAYNILKISGFLIDAAPGNSYDASTNSLLKGTSNSDKMIRFGSMELDRLLISDNIFLNAANGVSEPLVRAASKKSEIVISNNFFINNLFAWRVKSAYGKNIFSKHIIKGNSFILNWPYNPDTSTALPGTLEIGNKNDVKHVIIKENLFAYNVGGAISPEWTDSRGPKVTMEKNLFFENGSLFGTKDSDNGVAVGKFNGAAVHSIYNIEDIEDDFEWTVLNNISADPNLRIAIPKLKSLQDKDESEEKNDEKSDEIDAEISDSDDVDSSDNLDIETTDSGLDKNNEITSDISTSEDTTDDLEIAGDASEESSSEEGNDNIENADLADSSDTGEEDSSETGAEDDFGFADIPDDLNSEFEEEEDSYEYTDDLDIDEYASEGSIKNFAPRFPLNPDALPFSEESELGVYGASRDRYKNK